MNTKAKYEAELKAVKVDSNAFLEIVNQLDLIVISSALFNKIKQRSVSKPFYEDNNEAYAKAVIYLHHLIVTPAAEIDVNDGEHRGKYLSPYMERYVILTNHIEYMNNTFFNV